MDFPNNPIMTRNIQLNIYKYYTFAEYFAKYISYV